VGDNLLYELYAIPKIATKDSHQTSLIGYRSSLVALTLPKQLENRKCLGPLADNRKPVVRLGRKATDQVPI
jgi:hypothetical protein